MPETIDVGKTILQLAKEAAIAVLTPSDATDSNPSDGDEGTTHDGKVNNGNLLTEHNLKVMHFRPGYDLPGMTVAYREVNRNVIEIATAITHPNDCFTKKIGTRCAVEAFISGRTAFVPVIYKRKPATFTLKHYFA